MTKERREMSRIYVSWPISVITDKGVIEGESVNITASGIFVRSKQVLKENETCQMIIKLPDDKQVVVKGKLVWSNLDGEQRSSEAFANMGFSFVKVGKDDQKTLKSIISLYTSTGRTAKA